MASACICEHARQYRAPCFIVVDAVIGAAIGLLVKLPLIGGIVGILGSLIGLYFTISLVLSILHYLKVVK